MNRRERGVVKRFTVEHKMPRYLLIYYKTSFVQRRNDYLAYVILMTSKKVLCTFLTTNKRYFTIHQQIVRHFVHYSECLYHPLPFYANQIIGNFLTSRMWANQDKWLGFSLIGKSLYFIFLKISRILEWLFYSWACT